MSALTVDHSRMPILVITLDGKQSNADALTYCEAIEGMFDRRQPYGVLHLVHSFGPSVSMASEIGRWSLKHTALLRELCVGGAVVVDSGLFSFFMSAFQLVAPLPVKVEIVPTEGQALSWLDSRFVAHRSGR